VYFLFENGIYAEIKNVHRCNDEAINAVKMYYLEAIDAGVKDVLSIAYK